MEGEREKEREEGEVGRVRGKERGGDGKGERAQSLT